MPETLLTALRWLGAAYLAWLGVNSLLSSASEITVAEGDAAASGRRLFGRQSQTLAAAAASRQAVRQIDRRGLPACRRGARDGPAGAGLNHRIATA
jgi:threonine/homoserine/homoserine lactone efflux protein